MEFLLPEHCSTQMLYSVHTVEPVVNLMDRPFDLHQDQLHGQAYRVEVCRPVPSLLGMEQAPLPTLLWAWLQDG